MRLESRWQSEQATDDTMVARAAAKLSSSSTNWVEADPRRTVEQIKRDQTKLQTYDALG
jgi:hypothetical protein